MRAEHVLCYDRHAQSSIWSLLGLRWCYDLLRTPRLSSAKGVGILIVLQLFATSKDVSIGPVAVMSLTVSQIIAHVDGKHPKEFAPQTIATAVAFVSGFIVLGIGLLRLGWIVEFIPLPAVTGFMTGSAINIASGQVPGLMGITGFK